jgi:putative FmdB family regulatory protein
MPIYEYECKKCSTRFELRKNFGQNGDAQCPECASEAHRVFTPVPIIFKGSGFYITDSRKNNHQEESQVEKTTEKSK